MSSPAPDKTGATRAPATRKRKPWWLWALLALLALAILLFALTQCGNSTEPTSTAATPTTAPRAADPTAAAPSSGAPGNPGTPAADAAPAGAAAAGAAGAAGAGDSTLTADGTALLPVAQAAGPNGELTAQAGKTATARGVLVQSVPADEGFWVGTSDTDRVWVQLNGTGESGYVVQQGDRVDFTGQVTTHGPDFAVGVGVDAAEGADQLGGQGAHLEVAKPELRRSAA
jgi:hypothetical protein